MVNCFLTILVAVVFSLPLLIPSLTAAADDFSGARLDRAMKGMLAVISGYGLKDPAVLGAMGRVPRHEFVPHTHRGHAYENRALPIGLGQTISQPTIVAMMTDVLALAPTDTVLEVGTGSGYQAAVLAAVAGDVYTIDEDLPARRVDEARETAQQRRLPASRQPHDHKGFASCDVERDVAHCNHMARIRQHRGFGVVIFEQVDGFVRLWAKDLP